LRRKGISFETADPKQSKRIIKVAKIASKLFATKGYAETGMDDIAAATRVTKGGV
jgi:hypothetical protein